MNVRSVYVKLRPAEVEALGRLAHDQRRRPQDQAAYLLGEALKQATRVPRGAQGRAQDPPATDRLPAEAGGAP